MMINALSPYMFRHKIKQLYTNIFVTNEKWEGIKMSEHCGGFADSFTIIVVLFVLLIIVGAIFVC